MNVEKISKLASEMLLELANEADTLEVQLLKQRLKTVLVWKSIKVQDFQDEDRIQAIQHLY